MLSTIKNYGFWLLDYFQGGEVKKAYKNIEKVYEKDSTSLELVEYYKSSLETLFKQATDHTTYYQDFKGKKDILQYPVVDKKVIANRQSDFLSNKYSRKNLIKMSTSGSTGTPFVSYQNKDKKRRVNAETIFFNGKAGYSVGSKLIFLRSINNNNRKSKFKQWIQNQKILDVNKLDNNNIRTLLLQMKRFTKSNSATVLSYASTYDTLRDYFQRYGIKEADQSSIHGIISTSEILLDETRNYMSDTFNCKCYSRYANMENGMLGQDTPEHPNTFILNEANYYIEILKIDSNEPSKFGEVGRIVVTDLYNYAMPMIRYDTGDIGAFAYIDYKGKKKKAITNFGGRKIDMIFDINGNNVSPHKISVTFWDFPELRQFQFIQEGNKKYRVLLVVKDEFKRENELDKNIRDILGEKAIIDIEYVEQIPVLQSGKTKYIKNNTL